MTGRCPTPKIKFTMRYIIISASTILVLSVQLHHSAQAQSITPQVVATTGGHGSGTNVQLSWTLGEVAVTTLSGSSATITQGFHQTYDITTLVEESPDGLAVSIYPNPATDVINIGFEGTFPQLTISLHDMNGKLVHTSNVAPESSHAHVAVDAIASGTYLLRIFSQSGSVAHTYRIIKQ